MTTIVYASTNTSSQTIDTFNLPTEKIVNYNMQITAGNTTHYSTLDVSHDGIQTSEQQYSLAKTGITPIEFTVSIANNTGVISVTPTVIPTTFSIERTTVLCNLYSENTLSGRNIKTPEGLGIYFNGANNITIRQSNNNVFTYANTYVTSGVMGPIKTKANLLSDWTQVNGSIRAIDDNYLVAISSGQKDNCLTQTISVSVGKRYILTGNAYYTTEQNFSFQNPDRDAGPSRIEIGSNFGDNDLGDYIGTTDEAEFSVVFEPISNTIHVSAGFGDINNRLYVQNFELKEYVPFHTYNQDEGAIYIKWHAVAAGNTVLSLNSNTANNRIYVDSSNNVFVNSVNCGAQQATNKIALSYNANGIIASRNGNAVISDSNPLNKYINNTIFASIPFEFAYMSSTISNTVLVTLSNV
jgi:hypothetical protein